MLGWKTRNQSIEADPRLKENVGEYAVLISSISQEIDISHTCPGIAYAVVRIVRQSNTIPRLLRFLQYPKSSSITLALNRFIPKLYFVVSLVLISLKMYSLRVIFTGKGKRRHFEVRNWWFLAKVLSGRVDPMNDYYNISYCTSLPCSQ